jgi:hypothetical protein
MPGIEFVIDGVDPRALILLDDISPGPLSAGAMVSSPISARGSAVLQAPSARLFVYQRNLERLAGALESVESELSAALERELAAVLEEQDLTDVSPNNSKLLN